MTEQFEFNELCKLVHLGLHEQAKFYCSGHYNNLTVLKWYSRSNGALLCSYDRRDEFGPSRMFVRLRE